MRASRGLERASALGLLVWRREQEPGPALELGRELELVQALALEPA